MEEKNKVKTREKIRIGTEVSFQCNGSKVAHADADARTMLPNRRSAIPSLGRVGNWVVGNVAKDERCRNGKRRWRARIRPASPVERRVKRRVVMGLDRMEEIQERKKKDKNPRTKQNKNSWGPLVRLVQQVKLASEAINPYKRGRAYLLDACLGWLDAIFLFFFSCFGNLGFTFS